MGGGGGRAVDAQATRAERVTKTGVERRACRVKERGGEDG